MKHQPLFFDIETTGVSPIDKPYWVDETPHRVTAVGIGWFGDSWEEEGRFRDINLYTSVYMGDDEYDILDRVLGEGGRMANKLDIATGDGSVDEYGFLVGWNSRVFDHPYLAARASRFRLNPYPIQHRLKRLDMMRPCAREYGNRSYVSEDDYLEYIGLDNEDGFEGADMVEAFEDGRWRDIKSHCESDVEQMMEVFFRKREMMYDYFYDNYGIDMEVDFSEEVEF